MACLDNSSSSSSSSSSSCPTLMSPRISFSNDFAESHYHHQQQQQQVMRDDPARISDFEFSVSNNYSRPMMTTADELFFKGQFLPFKPTHRPTTLREELLVEEDEPHSHRRPKSSTARWKGFLGLRKSHIASKATKTTDNNAFDFTGNVE